MPCPIKKTFSHYYAGEIGELACDLKAFLLLPVITPIQFIS